MHEVDLSRMRAAVKCPLRLPPNRVRRTYKGGALLEAFRGYPHPSDDWYPEDWVASVVLSRTRVHPTEGISMVSDGENEWVLRDLIEAFPDEMLGVEHVRRFGATTRLLIKLIDSSTRLRIQVHPTRSKAKELLNSEYGKTESWVVLATRELIGENPYLLLGFKEGVSADDFRKVVLSQEEEKLIDMLHRVEVRPGDVFFVRAGMPHAIGPGVFMVELQEPSDHTIYVEPEGDDLLAEGDANNLGLGWDAAFECFEFTGLSRKQMMEQCKIPPRALTNEAAGQIEDVLYGQDIESYFSAKRLRVLRSIEVQSDGFCAAVILEGTGEIVGSGFKLRVVKGDTLFLPAGLTKYEWCSDDAEVPLEIITCHPPRSRFA